MSLCDLFYTIQQSHSNQDTQRETQTHSATKGKKKKILTHKRKHTKRRKKKISKR